MATINNGRREAVTITHASGTWTGTAAIAAPDEGNFLRVLVQADLRGIRGASSVTIAGEEYAVTAKPFRNGLVPVLSELHVKRTV